MQVRAGWAILGGILLGGALAWWASRETPEQARVKQDRAERAAAADAEDARPVLYRWRDADGVLQVTETPPRGRPYERIAKDAPPAIEVRGERN